MKTGILIIGSLYWDKDQGDRINHRSDWRNERLLQEEKIHVFAPIRYGRESDSVYTMVFSKEAELNSKWGTAYILPCKKAVETFADLKVEAECLSNAEGWKDKKLVKGGKMEKWCVIGILFNPAFDPVKRKALIDAFQNMLEEQGIAEEFTKFKIGYEASILKSNGEIDINWIKAINPKQQKELDNYDFILATCPQQNIPAYPDANAIKNGALRHKRKYFFRNMEHGITTFQDKEVLQLIKDMQ